MAARERYYYRSLLQRPKKEPYSALRKSHTDRQQEQQAQQQEQLLAREEHEERGERGK